jgi:fluoride exporter
MDAATISRILPKIAFLSIAGALGTLSRYALGGLVQNHTPLGFPWGTLVINVTGCLIFGFILPLTERGLLSSEMRIIITIGFLGAFTTFSSFVFETGQLLRDSEWLLAFANFAAQNVIGFAAFFVGLFLGRTL